MRHTVWEENSWNRKASVEKHSYCLERPILFRFECMVMYTTMALPKGLNLTFSGRGGGGVRRIKN